MVHQLKFSVNVFRRQILISISVVEKQIQSPALVGEAEIEPDEAMNIPPGLHGFRKIWVNKGKLNQNRKFTQFWNHIFHDCGSNTPCRLYMTT